jgi:hypothetical protein
MARSNKHATAHPDRFELRPSKDMRAIQAVDLDDSTDLFPQEAPHTDVASRQRSKPAVTTIALAVAIALALAEAAYIGYGRWAAKPNSGEQTAVMPPAPAALPASVPTEADPAAPAQSAASASGRLVVTTQPAGAQVFVDGRLSGTTPVTIENVAPGVRQVLVRRAGVEVRQSIRVEAAATVSMIAPLPGQAAGSFGWLAVSSPFEVDVSERDALLGTSRSRQIMLEAGTHQLVVANSALDFRHAVTVRIEAGKVQALRVAVPQSLVHINAKPWAEVSIDGRAVGETPIANLSVAIGAHDIAFRHPDYGERTVRAIVKADLPTRVTVDLTRPASPQ